MHPPKRHVVIGGARSRTARHQLPQPRRPNDRRHVGETSVKNAKDIEDRLYPMLRADNAEVVIYPWDRK